MNELGRWDGNVFWFDPPRAVILADGVWPVYSLHLGEQGAAMTAEERERALAHIVARTEAARV